MESRTNRHGAKMTPGEKGEQKTLGNRCVQKGAYMATGGSSKPPRKNLTGTVAYMALGQAEDVDLGKNVVGGQQDPGVGCASKTGKDGDTEGAIKAALESRIARNGADMAPEGIAHQKTPGVGGVRKGADMVTGGSNGPPRGKTPGTTNDEDLHKIKPRPNRVPTMLTGQAGSGGPWPHMSIIVTTTYGALSQK